MEKNKMMEKIRPLRKSQYAPEELPESALTEALEQHGLTGAEIE